MGGKVLAVAMATDAAPEGRTLTVCPVLIEEYPTYRSGRTDRVQEEVSRRVFVINTEDKENTQKGRWRLQEAAAAGKPTAGQERLSRRRGQSE